MIMMMMMMMMNDRRSLMKCIFHLPYVCYHCVHMRQGRDLVTFWCLYSACCVMPNKDV